MTTPADATGKERDNLEKELRVMQRKLERSEAHRRMLETVADQGQSLLRAVRADLDQANEELRVEKRRSELLLLNVLPARIAERLKDRAERIADDYADATVVFADLVGFTSMSARLSANALVSMLDEVFLRFDDLADQNGMEKIKTIGDAYMCVAGVPIASNDHAERAATMALDMLAALRELNMRLEHGLELRIGIHSGPVVAGVIGRRKFAFDLWGDTVNTASRMESHGQPGRIQISEETRGQLGADFVVEERGVVDVKGKGSLRTWWLIGRVSSGACALAG